MRVYVAIRQGQVLGVYSIRKEAGERGWVEEFELDIKLCRCGEAMTLRTVVMARNGMLWELEEWECVPCALHFPNWGEVKPYLEAGIN